MPLVPQLFDGEWIEPAVSEPIAALVRAGGEAIVNAAKHAGSGTVSVFVEVADGAVRLFVRDRGVGYDPATISEDRHGVRESIIGRMDRHGGTAAIRTAPGGGTEVLLEMPVSAP